MVHKNSKQVYWKRKADPIWSISRPWKRKKRSRQFQPYTIRTDTQLLFDETSHTMTVMEAGLTKTFDDTIYPTR